MNYYYDDDDYYYYHHCFKKCFMLTDLIVRHEFCFDFHLIENYN
jgi:hypothetical protein